MTSLKQTLVEKLCDAYGLELQAEALLKTTLEKIDLAPETRLRLKDHAVETRWQMRLLEVCLDNLGADARAARTRRESSGKKSRFPGIAMNGAFKNMEILAYKSAIAAATRANELEVADICAEILEQERAMAGWFSDRLYDRDSFPSKTVSLRPSLSTGQEAASY